LILNAKPLIKWVKAILAFALPPPIHHQRINTMIKSYIKIALRSFTKNITFSLINLFGLSIAFALFILLSLYITSELSTDKHIENLDNIYSLHERNDHHIFTSGLFASYISDRYPEVKEGCTSFVWDGNFFLNDGHHVHFNRYAAVDSNYFKIFKNEAILGNLDQALNGNNGMVLTQSAAKSLFADKNPIGEIVSLENEYDYVVNAVIPDLPENSFFKAECFFSIQSMEIMHEGFLSSNNGWSVYTFVELEENANVPALEEKLSKDLLAQFERKTNWGLIPYDELYFSDVHIPEELEHGNKQFVFLFIGIALFIIVIACINYINLTTATASNRAREVGIRKVVGAHKQKLIAQFLTESILLVLISLIIGFLLAELLIGEYNALAETNFRVKVFYAFPANIIFVLGAVMLGVISGLYPAFALTSFKTVEVLKGKISKSRGGLIARKALMVFQFVISLIMIVGSIVIYRQINHVKNSSIGFQKENIIRLKTNDENAFENAQAFKDELLAIPGVEKISFCYGVPGEVGHGMTATVEGEDVNMRLLECDNEFVDVMGMEMASGRSFSSEDNADYERSCMINEAAVRKYGWKDPYAIKLWGFKIVGIVKDFNFESLHLPVTPLFMPFWGGMDKMAIRLSGSNQTAIIEKIEKAWLKQYPEVPFNFAYVEQIIDKQYKAEERLGRVVGYFSVFALMIAFMGLLGMTSFMIQQRHREIGIRKVFGGEVKQIVNMLSFEFVKWVFIAFVISVPLSYYLMKTWLDRNFISQVELEWWMFAFSGFVVVAISLLTVSIQAYRAANMNPVDSLRYE
jgi:putative ABC transport system permease protein